MLIIYVLKFIMKVDKYRQRYLKIKVLKLDINPVCPGVPL